MSRIYARQYFMLAILVFSGGVTTSAGAEVLASTRIPGPTPIARGPSLRVDVDLVLVPVTVTDRFGRVIVGLDETNFCVLEDEKERPIVSFSVTDVPVSVCLLFDTSGSMRGKLDTAREVTKTFLETLNPDDEACLITFADRPVLQRAFTGDFGNMQNSLLPERPSGRTALVDAVFLALHQTRLAGNSRRALVIVSDGIDNHSRYTNSELMENAIEADTQIYTIRIDRRLASLYSLAERIETQKAIEMMEGMSKLTGGIHLKIADLDKLRDAMVKVGTALHDQYLIGYRPGEDFPAGKWRRIKVELNLPAGTRRLNIHARGGYRIPNP